MEKNVQQEQFLAEVEKHQKIIYKVCHLYTDSEMDFSDLYQEIMLNLWKGYHTFEGRSKLSTWIYRVALNTAFYKMRKDKMKDTIDFIKHEHYEIPDLDGEAAKDNLEMLKSLIGRLNDMEKAIITLHLDEYSYDDISKIVGITTTNVATKIHRIKKKLSNMLNV